MNDFIHLADDLERRYGDFFHASRQIAFDSTDVPVSLHPLIPYARFWGLTDDWEREELADRASEQIKEELKRVIAQNDGDLDKWLAGPEANSPSPTDAYLAFSAMRMCADYM